MQRLAEQSRLLGSGWPHAHVPSSHLLPVPDGSMFVVTWEGQLMPWVLEEACFREAGQAAQAIERAHMPLPAAGLRPTPHALTAPCVLAGKATS